MGIYQLTQVLESLISDHKDATDGLYMSLASASYRGRSSSECHIIDVLIAMFRLTRFVPRRPDAVMGCLTCNEIFNELFIKAIRSTIDIGLESYRVVFIADKERHKRNNLHLKRDEAARRAVERIRAAERSGKPPPKAYPPTCEFGDRGVREGPDSAWEPVDITRILISQGRPSCDAFWKYMQDRLHEAAESTSRDEMMSKLYRNRMNSDSSHQLMYCSIEADLVESDTDSFGEADIGILQRAIAELRKPPHPTPNRRTIVVLHTDDTDAVAHSIYAAWSLGLAASRLYVERSRSVFVSGTRNRFYVYDIVPIVALLVRRGWTRDHFLAACIIGGCDFFKSADGVTIRNVGAIPLWTAQSRIVGRLRNAVFPTPAAVIAMYVYLIANHCGADIAVDIPVTGGYNETALELISVDSISTMFRVGRDVRVNRGTRVLCPAPPLKEMREVCERFASVWQYWSTSFDVSLIPPHPSADRYVDVLAD